MRGNGKHEFVATNIIAFTCDDPIINKINLNINANITLQNIKMIVTNILLLGKVLGRVVMENTNL